MRSWQASIKTEYVDNSKDTFTLIDVSDPEYFDTFVDLADKMTETSAKLLTSGILDNTLNFKAHVTTERDKTAYEALVAHANITESWAAQSEHFQVSPDLYPVHFVALRASSRAMRLISSGLDPKGPMILLIFLNNGSLEPLSCLL